LCGPDERGTVSEPGKAYKEHPRTVAVSSLVSAAARS
jgi:hypothetical protein